MLLQCDEDEIRLLTALPSAWPAGRVTGLRARGGFEIDLAWKDGAIERVAVWPLRGGPLRLRRGEAHYQAAPDDDDEPEAAAMAMPVPRPPIRTNAVSTTRMPKMREDEPSGLAPSPVH